MKKNVVVITGSPRKGGNTDMLADAFIQGAKAAGHEVTKFDAVADPLQPCRACDACYSKGEACVFDDGLRRLAPLLEKADVIVFSSPVWWFSWSGQMKMVIDKLYPFSGNSVKKLKGSSYLLMCAGDPSSEIFTAVKHEYENSMPHLGLTDGGQLLIPGVYAKGDIKNTDALSRAEQLGRNC